jgi:RNA polymerase sigma factor (sigma-70 family)
MIEMGSAPMTDMSAEKAFWKRVLRSIARHARGTVDPEELMNIAFVRMEGYRAGRTVADPRAFLVRTAKNALIDNHRHEQISARFTADALQTVDERDDYPLQDEVFASRARLNRVKEGLEQLPPRTKEIFLMYRLDGLKCREIANRIGISESAVEKHIARAMHFITKWSEGW